MKKPASSGRNSSSSSPKGSRQVNKSRDFRPGSGNASSNVRGKKHFTPRRKPLGNSDAPLRLNRYISNAGICSRREADALIESGVVTVNGEIVVQMGFKVGATDLVQVGGTSIRPETKRYVLLNKPKGFGTSPADAKARRGVHELVQKACKEPIRSIDKLDRESTGLMLFTNDEELMIRLNNPSSGAARLYHIVLGEKVQPQHLDALKQGFIVDKGFVRAIAAEFANENRDQIGLKIVSSRSRIARRMMEQLGYRVVKVDRVTLGPLTKKDVPRGSFRHLTSAEVNLLRMSS